MPAERESRDDSTSSGGLTVGQRITRVEEDVREMNQKFDGVHVTVEEIKRDQAVLLVKVAFIFTVLSFLLGLAAQWLMKSSTPH